MEIKKYNYRFIARIVLEAKTPLIIGSGNKDIYTDATIAKDVNGLPYIPGTSIAGVVRHAIGLSAQDNNFFGFQNGDKGKGSEIIFSEAKMIGENGVAVDGLKDVKGEFYKAFDNLPVRQHVRITDKGVGAEHGKFDEEIIFKGTRFCFEIEVVSEKENRDKFTNVLDTICSSEFRIGAGSRKGFGKMEVKECKYQIYNLTEPEQLSKYLEHSSDLSQPFEGENHESSDYTDSIKYDLTLVPEDFFLFGAGFGDNEVDLVPVKEKVVDYDQRKIVDANILIPASSIKGALAHRVAFNYNKQKGYFVGNENAKTGNDNKAIQELFGFTSEDGKIKMRGNVLFEDIIEKDNTKEKVFNHVSIDRFTGGAIDGALFSEKASYGNGEKFHTTITLLKKKFDDDDIMSSFESALKDIINGTLPLGGCVNKGYGCFKGTILKNGEILK